MPPNAIQDERRDRAIARSPSAPLPGLSGSTSKELFAVSRMAPCLKDFSSAKPIKISQVNLEAGQLSCKEFCVTLAYFQNRE